MKPPFSTEVYNSPSFHIFTCNFKFPSFICLILSQFHPFRSLIFYSIPITCFIDRSTQVTLEPLLSSSSSLLGLYIITGHTLTLVDLHLIHIFKLIHLSLTTTLCRYHSANLSYILYPFNSLLLHI